MKAARANGRSEEMRKLNGNGAVKQQWGENY